METDEKAVGTFAFILVSWTGLFAITIISAIFMPFILGYALLTDDPEVFSELF